MVFVFLSFSPKYKDFNLYVLKSYPYCHYIVLALIPIWFLSQVLQKLHIILTCLEVYNYKGMKPVKPESN